MSYSYELTKRVNDISLAIISSSLGSSFSHRKVRSDDKRFFCCFCFANCVKNIIFAH